MLSRPETGFGLKVKAPLRNRLFWNGLTLTIISWIFAFLVYGASQGARLTYTQCVAAGGFCQSVLEGAEFEQTWAIILFALGAVGCFLMVLGKALRRKSGGARTTPREGGSTLVVRSNAMGFAIVACILIAAAIAALAYSGTPVTAPGVLSVGPNYVVVLQRDIALGGSVHGDFRAQGNFSVRLWIMTSHQYFDFVTTRGAWTFNRGFYSVTGQAANVSADLPGLETYYVILMTNASSQTGGSTLVDVNLTFFGFERYYFGAAVALFLSGGLAMVWSFAKGLREPVSKTAPVWKK